MAAAALSRIAKTRWAADKEEGSKIVWCWKIKGRGGVKEKKKKKKKMVALHLKEFPQSSSYQGHLL